MAHKYKIRYRLVIETRDEDFVPTDASDEQGLTDAMVVVSILHLEDGSYSQQIVLGADGRTRDALDPKEIFKMWMTMGLGLADSGDFTGLRAQILDVFQNLVREAFK